MNDIIWSALRRADVPAVKEPIGLIPGSDLRPDGLTLIPWQVGCSLAWDATVVDTLAALYLSARSTGVGSAAEAAVERKTAKYSTPSSSHIFIPVAIETLGPINEVGEAFMAQVCKIVSTKSDDLRECFILLQRISVISQRFNEISF